MYRHFHGVPQATALAVSLLMFRADLAGAQKVLPEGIKDLATQIATTVVKEQKHRIAVVPFRELDGRASVLGTFIAEELVTNLFTLGGLEIVERAMLDKVLGELRLAQTGLIDPETAKQVGKIAGVDAIVTGSITDLQSYVALNCRLIDAQTGRIFAAAQAKIVKDDDLRKIMGMLTSAPTETAKAPEPGRPAPGGSGVQVQPIRRQVFETDLYRVVVDSVRRRGSSILLTLTFENLTEKTIKFSWNGVSEKPYLIDENGQRFSLAQIDSEGVCWTFGGRRVELPRNTKLRTEMVFEGGGGKPGSEFTLVAREGSSREGREIVIPHLLLSDS